jgi:hypothetical protein
VSAGAHISTTKDKQFPEGSQGFLKIYFWSMEESEEDRFNERWKIVILSPTKDLMGMLSSNRSAFLSPAFHEILHSESIAR